MKLDYFIGRAFDEVLYDEDASEGWGVKLEGGVLVWNRDGRRTSAPDQADLDGTSLLTVNYTDQHTTMVFGHSNPAGSTVVAEVEFTPALYSLADPDYTGGEEVWPQREVEVDDPIPPDPSPERVADGPENPEEATEEPGVDQ